MLTSLQPQLRTRWTATHFHLTSLPLSISGKRANVAHFPNWPVKLSREVVNEHQLIIVKSSVKSRTTLSVSASTGGKEARRHGGIASCHMTQTQNGRTTEFPAPINNMHRARPCPCYKFVHVNVYNIWQAHLQRSIWHFMPFGSSPPCPRTLNGVKGHAPDAGTRKDAAQRKVRDAIWYKTVRPARIRRDDVISG